MSFAFGLNDQVRRVGLEAPGRERNQRQAAILADLDPNMPVLCSPRIEMSRNAGGFEELV